MRVADKKVWWRKEKMLNHTSESDETFCAQRLEEVDDCLCVLFCLVFLCTLHFGNFALLLLFLVCYDAWPLRLCFGHDYDLL